ncbi:L,D-transpeptidase family protein [Streptomyces roseirectus]|uniref:L,D-transpeptidase family protein n=1 Tax=Streptomyces roseirectus TaxID=2768066 RepID=A0A7H0IK38_9ACTN|nr:Ig-like domain-containing protein [Streptomyces roseirectus]QNP73154.1 L,D-transpeptidase family protein [Streptomyces roseirectus]
MSHPNRAPRPIVRCTLLVSALAAGATACGSGGHPLAARPYDASDQVVFAGFPDGGRKADPDKPLEITVKDSEGPLTDVTAVDAAGRFVAGELAADGRRWHSTEPLAANAHYTVRVSTEDDDGAPGRRVFTFDTGAPVSKKRLDVTFGPDAGTYGVGQPVTAELSRPVKDPAQRAVVERGLKVESTPAVPGAWHWVDDKELHYRPQEYWPAHARIRVRSTLDGIKIGDRLWGAPAKDLDLRIGDKVVAVTDASSHWMTVYKNGEEINSIPVTTGKPGFETRNGVKVVLGKEYYVRMRGTTVGISAGSSEAYDLPVYWATRVTWSGEYVHAAPWSVASQGSANVSHGCTGMSTGNAAWFFENVRRGDVVKVVNSYGDDMEPFGNGFGDWNVPWKKWKEGSALTTKQEAPGAEQRLTPEAV